MIFAAALLFALLQPGLTVQANVRNFGAIGDGSTDDSAAIETALANLTGGGILLFPAPGAYAVSRAIHIRGMGITLRGEGMVSHACKDFGSSLLALSTSNSTLIVMDHCVSCAIEHLGLHGAAAAHRSTGTAACTKEASELAAFAAQRRIRRGKPMTFHALPPAGSDYADLPTTGSAVVLRGTFQTTLSFLWMSDAFAFVAMSEMANTITIADVQIYNAYGPCAVCAAGAILPPVGLPSADTNRTRVDVLQMTRITANNVVLAANASVVWLDVGGGVNTVRLDNVGLINGGTGVRMDSTSSDPPGFYPGRPLFVLANDLEIDFPSGNAIDLLSGEEVQLSNGYIQGAGSTTIVDRRKRNPSLGIGLRVGPRFNSELMVTNTRFFGHALQAIELGGGAHASVSNNVLTENSIAKRGGASGIVVRANVSDFILSANHIGDLAWAGASQRYGIEVQGGASDRYVVSSNTLTGNLHGGLSDGGGGKSKAVQGNVV